LPAIARAVDAIVASFRRGGRLIYVGAGSSGRMGVLDASECPPTFSVSKSQVQAIIAGGRRALTDAVEGAEDSAADGARAIRQRRVRRSDVIVGIAAAGTTPFVLAALREANKRGAFTVALTANRRAPISKIARVTIAPQTGPEAIAGSTRMKAGTAQKLVLNMLSTTAMIRMGYVYDNWMINVAATNEKLKRRALRILKEASDTNLYTAEHALRLAGHDLRTALVMLKAGISANEARARLKSAHNNIRSALRGKTQPGKRK
jgi:N-acetylmuramic acid 6-phosphate etherase